MHGAETLRHAVQAEAILVVFALVTVFEVATHLVKRYVVGWVFERLEMVESNFFFFFFFFLARVVGLARAPVGVCLFICKEDG